MFCTIISILTLNAISWNCLTMWLSMHITPSTLFTQGNTNMFGYLGEPDHTVYNRTKTYARTVTCLITVLIVRAFFHAPVCTVLSEQSWNSWAFYNADRRISRCIPIETSIHTIPLDSCVPVRVSIV
jgi:hypothetical protein